MVDSNSPNRRIITGMFKDKESAERAYDILESRGYGKDDVNVIMSDDTRKKQFTDTRNPTDLGNKAMEGAGKGGLIGGTLGAIVGIVAAIGTSVLIPGLGLIIAGPLAAGLAGAGAGSIAGGLIGALVGAGIPKEKAEVYQEGVKNGSIVLTAYVRNDEDAQYIENEWRSNNGEEIYS